MSCYTYAERITLEGHVLGDKWQGIPVIGPILVNAAQPAVTLARVVMTLIQTGATTVTLDSDISGITISNATTWEVTIPQLQTFVTTAGDWDWNIQFYSTGDTNPQTYYYGVLKVEDI